MSTAVSLGMIAVGILVGLVVGKGSVWFDLVPDPQDQVTELRLASADSELTQREAEIERLELIAAPLQVELLQKDEDIRNLESSIRLLEEDLSSNDARLEEITNDMEELLLEKSSLEIQVKDLQDRVEEVAVLNIQINDLNSQIASLSNSLSIVSSQRDSLQAQLATQGRELTSLRRDLASLQTMWDLWKSHSALAPQARDDISYSGAFLPRPGEYTISTAPSLLISFEDPENCLDWGNIVATESMRPAMGGGHQVIFTTCFEVTDLRAGDIISYVHPIGNILHQIIEVRPEGVITKGINVEEPDPDVVPWSNIQAVVLAIIY